MESNQQIAGVANVKEATQSGVGYDRQDPKVLFIAGFGIATIIGLVVVVIGIQAYFDHVKQQQVTEEVLRPVAEDLVELRTTEENALNSYGYVDKESGVVRIPVSRAMELVAKEAAAGQSQYAAKAYPVKVPGAAGGTDGGPTSAANNNNPAVSANATLNGPNGSSNSSAGTPGTSSNAPNSANGSSGPNGSNSSQSGKK